jgi:monoamine oxidase
MPPPRVPFDLTGRVSGVRILIPGTGLAGMTVAYELGKVGYNCRVLEARPRAVVYSPCVAAP